MQIIRKKETCSKAKSSFLGTDAFSTTVSHLERSLKVHCCYALLRRLRPIN